MMIHLSLNGLSLHTKLPFVAFGFEFKISFLYRVGEPGLHSSNVATVKNGGVIAANLEIAMPH